MNPARDSVHQMIARQLTRFPDLDLTPFDITGLPTRDAGLARAIYHHVIQRWLTLTAVIESRLERDWEQVEHDLRAVLLAGAAQLLLMDRLPDHAVINEAVEWSKQNVRSSVGGFINAVLRKVASLRHDKLDALEDWSSRIFPRSDGQHWQLTKDVFAQDPTVRLAQQTSHPQWLIKHWCSEFGDSRGSQIARHDVVEAPIIISIPEQATPPEASLLPHSEDGSHVFTGPHNDLLHLLQDHSEVLVQDPTAGLAVQVTGNLQPKIIIDVCAGKGTKTKQLAQLHPQARIVSSDIDSRRFDTLQSACADIDQVTVVEFDQLQPHIGQADVLVLDVPCSNTGVLARRPEAKYRLNPSHLDDLVNLQREIIVQYASLLPQGAYLLYSTCSIDPAENEAQIQWITRQFDFSLIDEQAMFPRGLPGDAPHEYRDGGYYAFLRRYPDE